MEWSILAARVYEFIRVFLSLKACDLAYLPYRQYHIARLVPYTLEKGMSAKYDNYICGSTTQPKWLMIIIFTTCR